MPHPVAPPRIAAAVRPHALHPAALHRAMPRPGPYVVRGRPGRSDRPALPPGSPESWGAITDNTVLDRAAYPFPIYPCGPR